MTQVASVPGVPGGNGGSNFERSVVWCPSLGPAALLWGFPSSPLTF